MDYDKLIEQLNAWNEQHLSVVCGGKHFACDYLCENEDCIVVRAITAIETLRADLARVTAERDAAIKSIPHDCKTCAYHTVFFNGCTPDHDCTNPDGGCSNNYDRWKWRGIKED